MALRVAVLYCAVCVRWCVPYITQHLEKFRFGYICHIGLVMHIFLIYVVDELLFLPFWVCSCVSGC